MFDINFYIKVSEIKRRFMGGGTYDRRELFDLFEVFRSEQPIIYNIETTNACNMRCKMCPRTTMMTRPVESIDKNAFMRIVDQIHKHTDEEWNEWEKFVESEYGIKKGDMSENHFFTMIIPRVLQLHGYGDPLLDENMPEYVEMLSKKGIPTYFSCNPANIDTKKTVELFENGLSYIKYSIESVDDAQHKAIRGDMSDFSSSYKNIIELLDLKEKRNYGTTIIITMLNLNRESQIDDYKRLEEAFKGCDVYIYLKSEDQQWYRKDVHGTSSIHWSEFCKHPWMSVTVKSNGEVVMCMEDFNNEIILGDANTESLYDIWNGDRYRKLREDHFQMTPGIKCTEECDMKLIGHYLK